VSRRIPFPPLKRLIRLIDVEFAQARAILNERQEAIAAGIDLSERTGGGKDIVTLMRELFFFVFFWIDVFPHNRSLHINTMDSD